MQFRLTYQGTLLSETSKGYLANARATHKHSIRKQFHMQLKRLWHIHPYLKAALSYRETSAPQHLEKLGVRVAELGMPSKKNSVSELAS